MSPWLALHTTAHIWLLLCLMIIFFCYSFSLSVFCFHFQIFHTCELLADSFPAVVNPPPSPKSLNLCFCLLLPDTFLRRWFIGLWRFMFLSMRLFCFCRRFGTRVFFFTKRYDYLDEILLGCFAVLWWWSNGDLWYWFVPSLRWRGGEC